jgi:hypothetical protein
MKNLSDFFEEDLNMMASFIHGYLGKNANELTAAQGYQLGILTCNFSYYGILLRAEKRGESLSENDKHILLKMSNIIESFEGLTNYLITSYASSLEVLKVNDLRKYYQFMDSRGMHERNNSK